jgi:hypothetical protein
VSNPVVTGVKEMPGYTVDGAPVLCVDVRASKTGGLQYGVSIVEGCPSEIVLGALTGLVTIYEQMRGSFGYKKRRR